MFSVRDSIRVRIRSAGVRVRFRVRIISAGLG